MPGDGNTLCEGHERRELQQWIGNNLCPTDWGWKYRDESLVPLTSHYRSASSAYTCMANRVVRLQDRLSEDMRMPEGRGVLFTHVQSLQWTHMQHIHALAVSKVSDNDS